MVRKLRTTNVLLFDGAVLVCIALASFLLHVAASSEIAWLTQALLATLAIFMILIILTN